MDGRTRRWIKVKVRVCLFVNEFTICTAKKKVRKPLRQAGKNLQCLSEGGGEGRCGDVGRASGMEVGEAVLEGLSPTVPEY